MTFIVDDLDTLDFEELSMEYEDKSPVQLFLETLCEYHPEWELKGKHPTFYINQWLQVTVAHHRGAYCRIINSRKHDFSESKWGLLKELIEQKLIWLESYKPNSTEFLITLYEAYQKLNIDKELPRPVLLSKIYDKLFQKNTSYLREQFGLDLHYLVQSSQLTIDGKTLNYYPSANPHKAMCILSSSGEARHINSIAFK